MAELSFLIWSNEERAWRWKGGDVATWTPLIDDAHRFGLREARRISEHANQPATKWRSQVVVLAPEHLERAKQHYEEKLRQRRSADVRRP